MGLRKKHYQGIDIDEVFLDGHNTPGYSRENLEGVIESPITKKVFFVAGILFLAGAAVFVFRSGSLQIARADIFKERSSENYLRFVEHPAERGLVYDRTGEAIASNDIPNPYDTIFATSSSSERTGDTQVWNIVRRYPKQGFLHVLGFLRKDATHADGVSGIEEQYNDILRGTPGKRIEEVNAIGSVISSGTGVVPHGGFGLTTTLSAGLQEHLALRIENLARERGFKGGAAVVLDVRTGEVLALVSVPEFDPNVLVEGLTQEKLNTLLSDPGKPFFNRAVSGLYPPGSIIKPAVAVAALVEGIVTPETSFVTNGRLVLENPYFPDKPSIFLDWKNHGTVDMRRALAVSSDVYFYTIGGGYKDQKGLGVSKINSYLRLFGFSEPTGIDIPGEKKGLLPDPNDPSRTRPWTVGDTYNTSIGQGDVLVTPVQMAVYAATIATQGTMPQPHIAKALVDERKNIVRTFSYAPKKTAIVPQEVFGPIHDGMREAARTGTAAGLSASPIPVAAKTGTAEIGKTGRVHSWSIGFAPYDNPKIAFAVLMEDGSIFNLVGATSVAADMMRWMGETEFLDSL